MDRKRMLFGSLASFALILTVLSCGGSAPESPAPSDTPAQTGTGTLLVDNLPENVVGLELRDGAIHVKDGYKLEQQPDSTFMMIDPDGGRTGTGLGCGCKSPTGTCVPELKGGIAVCTADKCDKCGLAVMVGGTSTELAIF
jgi:hypothetical protein